MKEEDEDRWWMEGGTETCRFCLQRYVYEMEYRCACCDGPVCPMCAPETHERAAIVCPECADSVEE